MISKSHVAVLVVAVVLALLLAAAYAGKDHVLPEVSPMQRGAALADEAGCWSCHSEGAEAAAPSLFTGGLAASEIERGIREVPEHPAGLAPDAIDDLAAWIAITRHRSQAARASGRSGGPMARAERLARRECFTCHGELGQGGVGNPDSLKGYVPGFFGRDFDLLTRDGDPGVVREWIRDGLPRFFHTQGLPGLRPALWFSERQEVKMPGYARRLPPDQIEDLVSYMLLLREMGPMDAEALAGYRARIARAGRDPGPAPR